MEHDFTAGRFRRDRVDLDAQRQVDDGATVDLDPLGLADDLQAVEAGDRETEALGGCASMLISFRLYTFCTSPMSVSVYSTLRSRMMSTSSGIRVQAVNQAGADDRQNRNVNPDARPDDLCGFAPATSSR